MIPTRDRAPELERCLRSLERLPLAGVVVVDDGSRDDTAAVVARFPRARLLRNDEPVGAAQAKNQGAAATDAALLWFLDSDTELPAGFRLEVALRLLDETGVGAVGGEIFPRDDGPDEHRVKHLLPNFQTRCETLPGGYGCVREVDYLPTCNLLMRRALFEALGGFDPAYFILCEDADLCLRLRRRGLRCLVSDATSVLHHIALRGRAGDLFLVHRNRIRMALLHGTPTALALLPLGDLAAHAHPSTVASVLRGDISARKHLDAGPRDGALSRAKAALVANTLGLLRAYAWNLRHLPESLEARRDATRTTGATP